MISYQPKLYCAPKDSNCLPDSWQREVARHPSNDFVVSRDLDGKVASKYGDLRWIWTTYTADNSVLIFDFNNIFDFKPTKFQFDLIDEVKFVFFLLIWIRGGEPLSDGSLTHYLRLLKRLARIASSHEVPIAHLLSDGTLLRGVFLLLPLDLCKWLVALLGHLSSIGPHHVGYEVVGMGRLGKELKRIEDYRAGIKQHPPIPTRIYDHLLRSLSRELDEFLAVKENLLELAEELVLAKYARRKAGPNSTSPQSSSVSILDLDFAQVLQDRGLAGYFERRFLSSDIRSVSKALSEIQRSCALTIVALSGMRWGECRLLETDCGDIEESDGMRCHIIRGFTTKLNGGQKAPARWVTSAEGHRAIAICSDIAKFILRVAGQTSDEYQGVQRIPLLISTAYLELAGKKKPRSKANTVQPNQMAFVFFPNLRKRILLNIDNDDLEELEFIDPFRAWRAEARFKVGEPWPLTPHQLRRSLALYASRSGLVSMQSLRRQLQHLTEVMSRYYARGSSFAKDFIGKDSKHFGREYQSAQPISSGLSYLKNAVFSGSQLFGAHGTWIDRRFSPQASDGILPDRAETLALFKSGQMAYVETALGGCMSLSECNKRLLGSVTACIACDSLAGRREKLVRVIRRQEVFVSQLPEGSVERRTEALELEVLTDTLSRLDSRKGGTKGEAVRIY